MAVRRRKATERAGGKVIVVCATGASGAALAKRFLGHLSAHPGVGRIHFVPSTSFKLVARRESGTTVAAMLRGLERPEVVRVHEEAELDAPIASGSYPVDGTVVIPASMATLGALAAGAGRNLVHRAAEVALKEGRPLVLVPRETPLSLIHLRNLVTLKEAGAVVAPFIPAFYQKPSGIEELMDHFFMRVLDQLGLPSDLSRRWA
jgi:4-hydroxy-3-polyprenylbenzoate decarboxylase